MIDRPGWLACHCRAAARGHTDRPGHRLLSHRHQQTAARRRITPDLELPSIDSYRIREARAGYACLRLPSCVDRQQPMPPLQPTLPGVTIDRPGPGDYSCLADCPSARICRRWCVELPSSGKPVGSTLCPASWADGRGHSPAATSPAVSAGVPARTFDSGPLALAQYRRQVILTLE